jgi:hypothetical protein
MTTYKLISCKATKSIRCNSEAEAVAKAKQMEAKLQPSWGVTVEDHTGETVAWIRHGEDVWEC